MCPAPLGSTEMWNCSFAVDGQHQPHPSPHRYHDCVVVWRPGLSSRRPKAPPQRIINCMSNVLISCARMSLPTLLAPEATAQLASLIVVDQDGHLGFMRLGWSWTQVLQLSLCPDQTSSHHGVTCPDTCVQHHPHTRISRFYPRPCLALQRWSEIDIVPCSWDVTTYTSNRCALISRPLS